MIFGKSYVIWVSIAIQILLIWVNRRSPAVQPERVKNRFTDGISGITILLTGTMVTLFPAKAPVALIAAILALSSVLPPVIGFAENKFRENGHAIFALNRFSGHLASNLAGGAAALLFFVTATSTDGLVAFADNFRDTSAFNVVLPLSSVVVFAFIRWQQIAECHNIDTLVKDGGDWPAAIPASSLTAWNQIANTIHLLLVNFIGASTILYLFGYTILRAKAHHPLDFTWQIGCAMVLLVGFLFVCGTPLLWEHRAVYLTFLTGAPGVIIAAMIWLALLRPSAGRDIFAVILIAAGYLIYCALAVLGLIRGQGRPPAVNTSTDAPTNPAHDGVELFYFSAAILALALAVLLGALYFSRITTL